MRIRTIPIYTYIDKHKIFALDDTYLYFHKKIKHSNGFEEVLKT